MKEDASQAAVLERPGTASKLVLFARIVFWSAAAPVLMRFFALPRFMQLLTPRKEPRGFPPEMEVLGNRINSYLVYLLGKNKANIGKMCLRRSLVLYRLLRLQGVPARLMLGVRNQEGELKGHSWIEIEGKHFWDSQSEIEYKVTYSYPPEENGNGQIP